MEFETHPAPYSGYCASPPQKGLASFAMIPTGRSIPTATPTKTLVFDGHDHHLGRNFLVIIAQNVGKAGRLGNPGDSTTRCTVQLGVLFVDVKVEDRKGGIGPRSETGPGISLLLRTCSCALPVRFLDQPRKPAMTILRLGNRSLARSIQLKDVHHRVTNNTST